jgi:hypothetical protein
MTILWEFEEKHPKQFAQQGLEKSTSEATAVKRVGLSLDSLFLNLLGSVKASGAAKIGHLKNLILDKSDPR